MESKDEPMRLALTGCHSLIGHGVLRSLDRLGPVERVLVFDLLPPEVSDPRVEFHAVDLTRPGADAEMAEAMSASGVTTMLHAAVLWDAVRDPSWAHELESVGTDYVLAALLAAHVKRAVFTSSFVVYGVSHRLPVPITESAPLLGSRTLPPFKDKVAAEEAVASFASAHPEISIAVLRFAITLGRDLQRVISRTLRRPVVPTLMGFDPAMQFLHPDDVVAAVLLSLRHDCRGAFNIAPQDALPLSDVLSMGGRIPFPLPHFLAYPMVGLLWNTGLGDLHPSYLNLLRFSVVMDPSQAREAFGFVARSTRDTVAAFYGREVQP